MYIFYKVSYVIRYVMYRYQFRYLFFLSIFFFLIIVRREFLFYTIYIDCSLNYYILFIISVGTTNSSTSIDQNELQCMYLFMCLRNYSCIQCFKGVYKKKNLVADFIRYYFGQHGLLCTTSLRCEHIGLFSVADLQSFFRI